MKWLISLLVLISGFFIVSSVIAVSAQTSTQVVSFHAVCLEPHRCNRADAGCSLQNGHRVKLMTKENKLNPSADAYIVECISYRVDNTGTKLLCTTGNSTLDKEAFCGDPSSPQCQQYDFYSQLHAAPVNYSLSDEEVMQFKGISEEEIAENGGYGMFIFDPTKRQLKPPSKIKTTATGDIPTIEWQSFTLTAHDRRFMALQVDRRTVTATSPAPVASVSASPQNGQSQTTFGFQGTSTGPIEIPEAGCSNVKYDPEGTVFDAVSLEPIPNAKVTLLKNVNGTYEDAGKTEFGIVNPYTTFANGQFSFIVGDGSYKLTTQASNYSYPLIDVAKLNPNYKSVYSNIYPSLTGEEIIQKGKIEHRDIPLMPNNSNGNQYPVTLISSFQDINKITGEIVLQGVLSHPLTKINVYTQKADTTGKFVKDKLFITQQTDALGRFTITLDQKKLPVGSMYGIVEFEKALPNGLTDTTSSQNDVLQFDPQPLYLEGYAKDATNRIIPNAIVSIMTSFSAIPYYQGKADSTGYFSISSEFLPSFPYKIKFVSPTGTALTISPATFITQNLDTITSKSINLYVYKNSKGEIQNKESIFIKSQLTASPAPSNTTANKPAPVMMMIFILILLLGVGTGILAVYLFKKHSLDVS